MKPGMRFPPVAEAARTPQQRELAAGYATGWRAVIANPDGSLGGPFDATMRSPALAARLNGVSDYFRAGTALPPRLMEFAILVLARQVGSPFEWHAHCASALKAGVGRGTLETLARDEPPAGMRDDEALVRDLVLQLLRTHRLDDATFARARAAFGEQDLVDLVALCGYYGLVAMMLGAAAVEPPVEKHFEVPA